MDNFPEVSLLDIGLTTNYDTCKEIEISTYQGRFEIWQNGIQILSYQNPDLLAGVFLGVEVWVPEEEGSMVYFDNLRVCVLSM